MEHTKNGVPLFNENNYALWKGRMEVYLLAQGYEVWDTVQNGFIPTTNEQGKNNLVNDAKEKNIIMSGVIESAYHKVLGCKTTKNVWDSNVKHSSSSDEDSDSEEEANERVLFMAKQNKQEVSNNEEEGLTIEEFSEEAIKLIKELKVENICSNTLEDQVQGLKIEVEEEKCIGQSLQKKLGEINNTTTRDLKGEVKQKKQEHDIAFSEISRITQQMQEAKIERKESNQRYMSIVDQNQQRSREDHSSQATG